jgi:hypothetical protein
MAKKTTEDPLLEEEEEYGLVYNMWVTTMNITVEDGGTVILQTGKPRDIPPGP